MKTEKGKGGGVAYPDSSNAPGSETALNFSMITCVLKNEIECVSF